MKFVVHSTSLIIVLANFSRVSHILLIFHQLISSIPKVSYSKCKKEKNQADFDILSTLNIVIQSYMVKNGDRLAFRALISNCRRCLLSVCLFVTDIN